jgi:hypothetical protein
MNRLQAAWADLRVVRRQEERQMVRLQVGRQVRHRLVRRATLRSSIARD